MKAPAHPDQNHRLAALRETGILDTPREEDFDEIVAFVAKYCGTSISVINLIDENRQWFKAEVGLNARETPLDTSICSHAILEDSFVEIPDTLNDTRMMDNPLCLAEPGLRFYAGAQLRTSDGLPIGTLCVLDEKPRTLTQPQRELLMLLAKQVMRQIELRRATTMQAVIIKEIDHRVKNSLQMVTSLLRMQKSRASEDSKRELATAEVRVESIALLHDELHRSASGNLVDLKTYIEKISNLLTMTCPANVSLELDCAHCTVPSGVASNVGMIVNEAITNAVKYAFTDGQSGRIFVQGAESAAGTYRLTISDTGKGLPPDWHRDAGLGMKIIQSMAASLGNESAITSDAGGTTITIDLPQVAG